MSLDWSSLAGTAIDAGVTVGMGIYNNRYNAKQQRASEARQREYQIENALYGPSLQRKGLEMAGYNPMLALDSVNPLSHVPSSSQMASAMSNNSEMASGVRDFLRSAWGLEKDRREAEIEEIKSKARLNDALRIQGGIRTTVDAGRDIIGAVGDLADPSPQPKPQPKNQPKPQPKTKRRSRLPSPSDVGKALPLAFLRDRLLPIASGSLIPSHEGSYERRLREKLADYGQTHTIKSRSTRGAGEKIRRRRRLSKGFEHFWDSLSTDW